VESSWPPDCVTEIAEVAKCDAHRDSRNFQKSPRNLLEVLGTCQHPALGCFIWEGAMGFHKNSLLRVLGSTHVPPALQRYCDPLMMSNGSVNCNCNPILY
jgi:hypothetical protein